MTARATSIGPAASPAIENAWLSADAAGSGPIDDVLGHSITYRIAVGPRAGQKLLTLLVQRFGGDGCYRRRDIHSALQMEFSIDTGWPRA
ncbi:MAG: hypothetical protein ABI645_03505 [Pseudomonadota bacterium]